MSDMEASKGQISKEIQQTLAQRAELRAKFADKRSELEKIRAQVESLDAKLINSGHLSADVIMRW